MRSKSLPSIRAIQTGLTSGDKANARKIRRALERAVDKKSVDAALDITNDIIGGFGVEAIHDNEWDGYYLSIGLLYVNTGDTYNTTLVYDTRSENFRVCSWGDIVERNERRFTDR